MISLRHDLIGHMTNIVQFWLFTDLWIISNKEAECRGHSGTSKHRISHANRDLRLLGTIAINVIGLAIVTTTLPVFLCTSETYMDFVLNAAATLFIVELDDLAYETTTIVLEDEESTSFTQKRLFAYYKRKGDAEEQDLTWDFEL